MQLKVIKYQLTFLTFIVEESKTIYKRKPNRNRSLNRNSYIIQ
ncbi:MAG: hypothetical protein ACMUEL_06445 [Flavobacteriales bacterium Tduv]